MTQHPETDFLEKVAALSPAPLIVFDLQDRQMIFCNERADELFGPSVNFSNEKKSALHPKDYQRHQDILERCQHLSDGEEIGLEVRIKTAEKQWQIFKISYKVFQRKESGTVSQLIGTAHEIPKKEDQGKSSEGKEDLLQILEKVPEAFAVLTPSFRIEMASDTYLSATLSSRKDIIGQYAFDAFPDNPGVSNATGVSNLKSSFKTVLATKKSHRMPVQHYDVPRPDGGFEEKYWNIVNTPVLNAAGEVRYIIHRVVDVTENVKTKAALEIAVEAAQLGTWDFDLTKGFVGHRNFRHDQIFGYEEPQRVWTLDLAKKHILPEDLEFFEAAHQRALETGKLNSEFRVQWKDGSIHWMGVNGRYYFVDGKAVRAAGVNFDITDRRKAEQDLRESKDRLQRTLSIETVGVIYSNLEGIIHDANPAFEKMTGFSTADFRSGRVRWSEITPPEFIEATSKSREELLSEGQNTPYQKQYIRADGSRFWGLIAGKKLSENEFVEFVVDITEEKKIEQDLIEAKEDAEAASRAKEDFVSTMSHEIRTPLNAIIGLTNLLLEQNPREDQKENLNSLIFSSKTLLALINGILDLSKLEAGKLHLAENEFYLQELLVSLEMAHKPMALDNASKIRIEFDERIPDQLVTDQLKLSQVLHNLVSNAVKFTENGTIVISVKLARREKDRLWLDFSISDTGIGITEEQLTHIFEKFSQADSSIQRYYGGTGLGLSITKLLLDLMGGRLDVESKAGEGSRFYFTLPVKAAKSKTTGTTIKSSPATALDLQQKRVLLVEDVEINRNIILQFMQNWWELTPDEAKNGKEAVEKAKKGKYDLILMDVRMPEMDGYEATRKIRELAGYENTPILALTADKSQEALVEQERTGFSDLLTKPFDPQELKEKILEHFAIFEPGSESQEESRKTTAGEASSQPFDISRYRKIAGQDSVLLKKLLDSAVRAIGSYKEEFAVAAREGNQRKIADLVHKNTVSVYYLQADELAETIKQYRKTVDAGAGKDDLRKKISAVSGEFDKILKGLLTIAENET